MAVVLKNKKTKLENLGFAHFCGGGGSRKVLTRKLQFSTMRKKILCLLKKYVHLFREGYLVSFKRS